MDMDLERRIKKLEWTNRLLIVLWGITIVGGGIGYAHSKGPEHLGKVVADSVETRSLTVDDPGYGKQAFSVDVGDDGMVGVRITDVKGEDTIDLLSVNPVGEASLCVAYRGACRIVIGSVQPGKQPEFSIQLRDEHGHPVWMPTTSNPYIPSKWMAVPANPHIP